jgi:hypothetical protein
VVTAEWAESLDVLVVDPQAGGGEVVEAVLRVGVACL